jgi:ubiquinone/menaquinone biosynthesis C-methylase UbiE
VSQDLRIINLSGAFAFMTDSNNTVAPNFPFSPQEIAAEHVELGSMERGSCSGVNHRLHDVAAWFDKTPAGHGAGPGQGAGPASFFWEPCNIVQNLLGHFDCGLKILDLGCGCALDSITLVGETNEVWAIDIAPQRLAKARANICSSERSRRISISWMDAQNLAFPDESFDLILANSFLMWVDKDRVLRECNRVLKRSGRVIFSMETMAENPILKLNRMRPSKRVREKMVARIVLADLRQFSTYYSKLHSWQFFLLSPMLYPIARWNRNGKIVPIAIRWTQKFDSWLLQSFPKLRRYAWVSVLEFVK